MHVKPDRLTAEVAKAIAASIAASQEVRLSPRSSARSPGATRELAKQVFQVNRERDRRALDRDATD